MTERERRSPREFQAIRQGLAEYYGTDTGPVIQAKSKGVGDEDGAVFQAGQGQADQQRTTIGSILEAKGFKLDGLPASAATPSSPAARESTA